MSARAVGLADEVRSGLAQIFLQQPPLARVRREALSIFYNQNTFLIEDSLFLTTSNLQQCFVANDLTRENVGRLSYAFTFRVCYFYGIATDLGLVTALAWRTCRAHKIFPLRLNTLAHHFVNISPTSSKAHCAMATPTLLGMPAEIRNEIFELALIKPFALNIGYNINRQTYDRTIARHRLILKQPPITLVNHQTRCEALAIFYGQNTFLIDNSNFNNSSDLLQCWRAFANNIAQGYITKLSYDFRTSGCTKWSTVNLVLDEVRGPEVNARGVVIYGCLCSVMSRLRELGNAVSAAVTSDQRYRAVENAVVELAERMIPGLLDGIKTQNGVRHTLERVGGGHTHPVCLGCGEVQWTASQRAS
ncbi:hypothetical protein LTR97_012563 [Elasticomyces elasticus]|uniref:Uncharacterized protein n=1 Tax=Elasticomyces elasticus TaxID=574655 RepID=A0AAN7W1W1_9PEZI|nr:hypothetical protein LTR97_012563 [Elasticomyces elasticus]